MDPRRIFDELMRNSALPGEQELCMLLDRMPDLFMGEATLLRVSLPLTILGDVHGQFSDLREALRITGTPPYTSLLLLGDYVDRGLNSLEVVILLLAAKLLFPRQIYLIRGNHETRAANYLYGFYAECVRTYSARVFDKFQNVFDTIPLAAVINNRVLAVHAGLSPLCDTLNEIAAIQRPNKLENDSSATDLLWSDPDVSPGFGKSYRGAGFTFGQDVTESFLRQNGLKLIVRGHQMVMDGYQYFHDRQVVTVFSAPNYCYRSGNKGAVMEIQENLSYTFVVYGWEGQGNVGGVQTRAIDYFV